MIGKTLCGMLLTLAVVMGARAQDEPKQDTREGILKDTIKAMNDMAAILEGVKDEASAKAARPKLEEVYKRIKDLKKRNDKLGEPSEADKKALEKHAPEFKKAAKRLGEAAAKAAATPGGADLLKTLETLKE